MSPVRKHYFAHIPGMALFILFAISPWLGFLVWVLKKIDRDAEKKEEALWRDQAGYTADFRAEPVRRAKARPDGEDKEDEDDDEDEDRAPLRGHDMPTAEQRRAKKWQKTLTDLCTLFGVIFLIAGLSDVGAAFDYFPLQFGMLFSGLAQAVGGGGAIFLSTKLRRARKLERQLDKVVGDRDNIPLDELFAAAGLEPDQGRTTLENAIDHGYFGADAYIDNRTRTLVVRGPAPQPPAPPKPQPAPASASPEQRDAALLRELHQVNEAIPDPAMTAKITRLEQLAGRIFALAQQDPSKQAQLQKFMDYYLPTALKLLRTYAQIDPQDLCSPNIAEARRSIERSMDLLITAFENQLDKLYQADALDVSADVAALEGMMNLDGLTGNDFDLSGNGQ